VLLFYKGIYQSAHFIGIPLNRFARIKNYCEDIDEDLKYRFSVIPQIDVKVLELLTQVCGYRSTQNCKRAVLS
jgi:hypothetical protein